MGTYGEAVLHYVPALKHTYQSEVNLSKIPPAVPVAGAGGGRIERAETKIKGCKRGGPVRSRHSLGHDRQGWRLLRGGVFPTIRP